MKYSRLVFLCLSLLLCAVAARAQTGSSSCGKPTNLTVTPTPVAAKVSWEGTSDGYNLRYREVDLNGKALVILTAGDIWEDGTGYQMLLDAHATAYGNIIPEEGPLSRDNVGDEIYDQFEYKIPTNADGALNTSNIVLDNSVSILIPAGTYDWCITNPNPDGSFVGMYIANSYGNVGGRQNDYVFEANMVYEFTVTPYGGSDQVNVNTTHVVGSGNFAATEWTTVNNATSPCTIKGLSFDSLYEVQVQGDCGNEQSEWVSKHFVTVSLKPTDVAVEPETTTANVTWNEQAGCDSYNLRYRTTSSAPVFTEDWDGEVVGSWDLIDPSYESGRVWEYGYNGSIGFQFYYTTEPPAYLISPEITGVTTGMKLEFYYKAYDGSYPESFRVGFSSTSKDISAFDFGDVITTEEGDTEWHRFSETIPAGTKYFCVKYTSYDKLLLIVDEFIVKNEEEFAAGEWTTIEGIEDNEYEITGLEPDTRYEVQVQAVFGEQITDWSDPVTFATHNALNLLNDDSAPGVEKNHIKLVMAVGTTTYVALTGRTFFKDGNWNTLCLPFRVSAEQLADKSNPLYGATIKKFYSGEVTGKHVDIIFSDAETIEKGECYIFKWDVVGEDIISPVFKDVEIEDDAPYITKSLDNGNFQIFGNYDAFAIDPAQDGCYTYYLTSAGDLKYSDKPRTLKTFRIFFRFFADNADAGALDYHLDFGDGDMTGIVHLDGRSDNSTDGYYNLQGMKYVGKPQQKGIYINNGHKVVVK